MATDFAPGKFVSEKGGFYFSCDEGNKVLIGITKEQTVVDSESGAERIVYSTCPILGIHKFDLDCDKQEDLERLIKLEEKSETLYGTEDSEKILKVPINVWIECFPEESYLLADGEWGSGFATAYFGDITEDDRPQITHVIAATVGEGSVVIRFHFAFE